ncbi:MAG: hypothetical protein N2053_01750 [Chitinispirillaceae bacterium]|nr:hypothetical protein [Chitinispirillaceae bacterium]
MKKIILLIISFLFLRCIPPSSDNIYITPTISVEYEKLSLSPLISEAKFETLPEWPKEIDKQKILLETFDEIWFKLLTEFRRCEKYGLYTMVSDKENPTIRISIIISSVDFTKDTLSMPIRLVVERLRDNQQFVFTIPAIAVMNSPEKKKNFFHYYGKLLADYKRRFPYKEIVSFFYGHSRDE